MACFGLFFQSISTHAFAHTQLYTAQASTPAFAFHHTQIYFDDFISSNLHVMTAL
ncbi:MAG: hypothetical protein WCG25_03830 [bacterium]